MDGWNLRTFRLREATNTKLHRREKILNKTELSGLYGQNFRLLLPYVCYLKKKIFFKVPTNTFTMLYYVHLVWRFREKSNSSGFKFKDWEPVDMVIDRTSCCQYKLNNCFVKFFFQLSFRRGSYWTLRSEWETYNIFIVWLMESFS